MLQKNENEQEYISLKALTQIFGYQKKIKELELNQTPISIDSKLLETAQQWDLRFIVCPDVTPFITSKKTTLLRWAYAQSFRCIKTLKKHLETVNKLIQLKNRILVSASTDSSIKLWDITNLPNAPCINTLYEHQENVCDLLQLKDGTLVSSSMDKTIKLWDMTDPHGDIPCIKTLNEHDDIITQLMQLEDGTLTSSSGQTIYQWNINNPHQAHLVDRFGGSLKQYNSYTMLNNGIVARIGHKSIELTEGPCRPYCLNVLKEHKESVRSLIKLNDGTIASGSDDSTIKLWRPYTCKKKLQTQLNLTDLALLTAFKNIFDQENNPATFS